jgi:hypothetical protein
MENWDNVNIPNYVERLVRKIEKAEDFGYDDEAVALSNWCDKHNLKWFWSESLFSPEVILCNKTEDNFKRLCEMGKDFDVEKARERWFGNDI